MGMPEHEFWHTTPKAFGLKVEGWMKGRESDQRLLAWAVATVLNGCGRLRRPVTVDDLLDRRNEAREAKEEDKEHFARMLNRYG